MKRTIKLAVVAALALGATSAFATNGSTMLGMGAKTRGIGGIGIGMGHGAESALSNPALITTIKKDNEISFGGTLFMPDVEVSNTLHDGVSAFTSGSADSDSDMFVIPSVSVASKINDNFYAGVGMWGTGGLGVDYRDTPSVLLGGSNMQMVTALQLMQFGVPLVYVRDNYSIGITPIIQYGSLDIDYEHPGQPSRNASGDLIGGYAVDPGTKYGSGANDDLAFGYNIGLAYETNGITIGAVYKSEIEMEYKGVMSSTISPFVNTQLNPSGYTNDKLSSPAEMGVGVSYNMNEHTIALDWKNINWSDAAGYEDFEWEDQDVISIGYEYATTGWAVRCGYAFADSAVKEQTVTWGASPGGDPLETTYNSAGLSAGTINTFNALGFPGNVESHFTIGGTYKISEMISVDLAAVFAAENEQTFTNFAGQDIKVAHSETSYSFQLNYAF
ncbi:outer membrane protein transport protein [Candidatus Sulfurimonas marisnigri]|uniref:Outer membrane protein transport protein n=1 Tax=Candidatus Sulfurimonas marisnigri TaxID=2740405 RepID=A0A7S7M054_9BACT|nr:outer membrane protein transport protein [Candidatus Sulfurimonas marisnigri]QOY54622.1 outer membrane protein transport protein [Candidatus Sulfurimonas marisnigri]